MTSPTTSETFTDLRRGSKSFYLASRLFPRRTRDAIAKLYRWCRYVDDQIDLAPTPTLARQRLAKLEVATSEGSAPEDARPLHALDKICLEHHIDRRYPLELIRGLRMDVDNHSYQTLADVELYAYRVAGVVGLMMCPIMGVASPEAAPHAVALGQAMQLTNIARDVREDFARGRVYVPQEFLTKPLTARTVSDPTEAADLFPAIIRLLDHADTLYRRGLEGLNYLPWRARLAVGVASAVYRAIGQEIRARGPGALCERVILSRGRKLRLAASAIWRVLVTGFESAYE